ncbi:hypothetical protein POMI540_4611 [Schizosaccharomyces pombe]
MKQYSAGEAPAKRLFLIVGDGLRPDKLLQPHSEKVIGEEQTYAAPFLRSIIQNNGTFGVSHTRVPTESRPGHVALIAGFYEDVSAVTKGWKKNPVNFDSVFNQSRHTYSFGSEDILPMFSEGASDPSRVDTFMYSSELEDFSSNGIVLDEWVFDRLDELLAQSLEDKELWDMLHRDKIVFFLHLLGIDTIGHNKHPDSVEYVENIQYIDGKIQELVDKMNNYYNNDGASSWVFTADHGMSDFGSHGDGNLDNTRTPIIAWGAGIQSPTHEKNYGHDEYSLPWNLTEIKRIDIQQADIAALMSYLVGLNFPVNSVGQIPLDYLDCSSRRKAEVALMNALEIGEQYNLKSASKDQTSIFFRPYSPLRNYTEVQASFYNSVIADIESGEYEIAIEHCFHFSQTVLSGLRLWMELETELQKYTEQLHPEYSRKKDAKFHLSLSHIRISLFFYIFINVAFFGTGNVASLSTFALDSVKRFIPVFNPVTQGALLMYTILVPFIALSAAFGIMNKRLGGIQQVTFFLAVGMADIVTINFFYLVKDEGSWKDIGVSISHFCISNFLILFITALEHASAILCKNITYTIHEKVN